MFIGALLLVLLVPHWLIEGVIAERESNQQAARAGVAQSWGPAQTVLGPVLIIPTRTPATRSPGDVGLQRWIQGSLALLPSQLGAEVRIAPERRWRGLFDVLIYEAGIKLSASFLPQIEADDGQEILWREAYVVAGVSDLRSAGDSANFSLDGRALVARDAPLEGNCRDLELMRWDLGLEAAPAPGDSLALAGTITLRGTGSLGLLPLARRTAMTATAPWPTPSFFGAGLPVRSDVTDTGFSASWGESMAQPLLRQFGPGWCHILTQKTAPVGVELLEAVPTYRMVTRASKYAAMFLALAFLTYVLFELLAGVGIHLVQYGLLGLSVVLFPLLLLAFGEPLGFAAAYAISTAAVVGQASAYTAGVTRRIGLAGVFAGVLAGLFGFLYVVLSLEAYALLVGAVALFAALSVVMLVTRHVDWSRS